MKPALERSSRAGGAALACLAVAVGCVVLASGDEKPGPAVGIVGFVSFFAAALLGLAYAWMPGRQLTDEQRHQAITGDGLGRYLSNWFR